MTMVQATVTWVIADWYVPDHLAPVFNYESFPIFKYSSHRYLFNFAVLRSPLRPASTAIAKNFLASLNKPSLNSSSLYIFCFFIFSFSIFIKTKSYINLRFWLHMFTQPRTDSEILFLSGTLYNIE